MAYDSARQRVVLFGGGDWLADTWEWDGSTWVDVTPALSPPARVFGAMAYDSARQRVVLFGGRSFGSGVAALADTWEWDGTNWVDVSPAVSPPGRAWGTMAYDSARGRAVLFGGRGDGQPFGDTWEWDGSTWTNVTPPLGPPGRTHSNMAYDSGRQRVVLFGGSGSPSVAGGTWEWDGASWVNVTPATSPPGRSGHAMAYDSARGRVVLFGDSAGSGDTWEYDGAGWMDVTPAPRPRPSYRHAMAYDGGRGRVVLFGGFGAPADTWEWDGTAWLNVTPAVIPPPRHDHAMAYDSARGRVVLFGGEDGSQLFGDTWEWDGTTWENVTAAVSPPAASDMGIAYDSARRRVVLFGGPEWGLVTWEWDGTTWESFFALTPVNREGTAMAYDSARQRVVLFGGTSFGSGRADLADTWEWDGASWVNVTPAMSPPPRSSHALAYDSALGRVVLFGGHDRFGDSQRYSDTWAWDGSTWTEITPAVSPPGAYLHAMAYDSARDRLVLFGGLGSDGATWEYGELFERRCDGLDDNGEGTIDEGCDDDTDGYCDAAMGFGRMPAACPLGGGDCDDANPDAHPSAAEVCDGIDNDCSGAADDLGDGDADLIDDACDNCPLIHNPSQTNSDGIDDGGDACDMSIHTPLDGAGLCDAGPPTIRWSTESYGRFRVEVSWDPQFREGRGYSSEMLAVPFWTPPERKWQRGCENAQPNLYIRVFGKVANGPVKEISDALALEVR